MYDCECVTECMLMRLTPPSHTPSHNGGNIHSMLIPNRKGYLVKSEDGENLRVTLCQTNPRANQLIADYLLRLDPFQNAKGKEAQSKLDLEWS